MEEDIFNYCKFKYDQSYLEIKEKLEYAVLTKSKKHEISASKAKH